MRNVGIIMRRELASYFATPLAYIFLLIFLVLVNLFTFYLGEFFERGQADLNPFFSYHPWLFLFLIPAVSMRLWADERRSGSIELLMTLPVTLWQAVVGKFLAAWAFTILALALTFPIWLTVNFLGSPDNGAILAAYIGSMLLAAGFLSIGSLASALTRNPVIAFIVGIAACFAFLVAGSLGFLTHYEAISKGVIDIRDLIYFALLITWFLLATAVVLDVRKSE
jgi:ABC-2 type transport system permease protein